MKKHIKKLIVITTVFSCFLFTGINVQAQADNQEISTTPNSATPPTEATGTTTEETPDGTGSVTDSNENKQFVTVTTKSGKVFYLIIDHSKTTDNVYLLTEVSEYDLLNFVEVDEETINSTIPELPTLDDEKSSDEETDQEMNTPIEEKQDSKLNTYIFYGVIMFAFIVAAYYFKIYKPKKSSDKDVWIEDEIEDDTQELEEDNTIEDDEIYIDDVSIEDLEIEELEQEDFE